LVNLEAPFGRLAAIAPDGSSTVLPLGAWPSEQRLGLKLRGSTEIVPIPDTDGAQDVGFSPDGLWITYRIGRDLFRRALAGGGAERLAGDADQMGISWLEDGTILYRPVTETGLIPRVARIPAEGGAPLQVIELSGTHAGFPIWTPGLPGGGAALVVHCGIAVTCAADTISLYALDLTDGSLVEVMAGIMRAWYLPDLAHLIVVRADGAVLAIPFDLGTLRPEGSAVPLFEGVRLGGSQADMVLGGDGTVLYVEGEATAFGLAELVLVDRAGTERPLDAALPTRGYTSLALSPDHRRLALSIESVLSSEIWVKELPEGPLTRVTEHASVTRWPTWSADGSTITYINNQGGTPHVRGIRADGGSTVETVLQRDLPVLEAVHAPDMRGLYFREGAAIGETRVGYLDLTTGNATATPATPGAWEGAIALSPDGGWLAYASNRPTLEVFVRRAGDDGPRTQVSISGGVNPVWAHNGRELFYREPASGAMMVAGYTLDPEFRVVSRTRLFDARAYRSAAEYHGSFDVTSDDQSFVMMRSTTGDTRIVMITNWLGELRGRLRR